MRQRLSSLARDKARGDAANTSSFVPTSVDDDWRNRLPHAQNRYKGQLGQLNLVERARQKVLQEREDAEERKREEQEKKARERAFLDELAERNRELIRTSTSVELGAEGVLKRREKESKERQRYAEQQEIRDHRRALREKR